ncbi:hypothetical protein GFM44_39480 [Rhizobium leguminosarum bv. viciae]|nr:hypothetical protein [Rhizobium leguminosarum bv. viciae]
MMSRHWFWSSRNRIGRLKFQIEAGVYKRVDALARTRSDLKVLRTVFWLGAKSLFWVAVSLIALIFFERVARNLEILRSISDTDKDYYLEQLRLYSQILASIFSIYFATIGIILSSGYNKLRRDVIGLLTSEQVGSVYSRALVFSASFCIAAAAIPMFGVEPGYLIYSTGTLLTLATSLTLFPLGQRLFSFFDLNPLVRSEILPNIAKHIEGASSSKNSISLANHHSVQARHLFEQMTYIDDRIKADAGALDVTLPALTDDYTGLLIYYLNKKNQIDQSSYWFPRRQSHRQWFYAGDTATTMALRTSSQLTPDEKIDLNWLETEIITRLKDHLELAVKAQKYDLALKLLGRLSSRIATYAHGFHFDIGMSEIKGLRSVIEGGLSQQAAASSDLHKKTLISLFDAWAALGGNLCLESLRRMITFEKELAGFFEKDEWTAGAMRQLPAFLQVETSFIARRVAFELIVEGRRLSQPKYLRQLVVQRLLKTYAKILPDACDFHQTQVTDFARSLIKADLPEAATQILLANLHSYWKLPRWLADLSQLLDRYGRYQHYSEDQYSLAHIDIDAMIGSFASARDQVIEMILSPEVFGHILSYEHEDDMPDQFGHIYYALAEECISALQENQPEKLKRVGRTFVALASLAADHKFTKSDPTVSTEFRLHLISTVLQDLASVVGFSILYGEYYNNPELSETIKNCFWDFIDKVPDKKQYLTRMLRLSDAKSFSWSASPRNIIRIEWRMAFERRAREDGYGDRMSYGHGKEHASEIVNEFLKSHSDASDVFFALEVLPLIDEVDFKVNYSITHLAKQMAKSKRAGKE